MTGRGTICGSGEQHSLKRSIFRMNLVMLLLVLTWEADSGMCMPRSSYELDQEPASFFSSDEVPNPETGDYKPRITPQDEQKTNLLYQLMKQYLMEAKKHNIIAEGDDDKIERNYLKKRVRCVLKGGCPWVKRIAE